MSQDSLQTRFAELVETAAKARRIFPYGGFENLTSTEIQALLSIAANPGRSPGDVADSLAMEKSSVSEPLASLESSGLVSSTPQPEDRRGRSLSLSPAGEALACRFLKGLP